MAVLARLQASTTTSRRQYGATNRRARRKDTGAGAFVSVSAGPLMVGRARRRRSLHDGAFRSLRLRGHVHDQRMNGPDDDADDDAGGDLCAAGLSTSRHGRSPGHGRSPFGSTIRPVDTSPGRYSVFISSNVAASYKSIVLPAL